MCRKSIQNVILTQMPNWILNSGLLDFLDKSCERFLGVRDFLFPWAKTWELTFDGLLMVFTVLETWLLYDTFTSHQNLSTFWKFYRIRTIRSMKLKFLNREWWNRRSPSVNEYARYSYNHEHLGNLLLTNDFFKQQTMNFNFYFSLLLFTYF